MAKIETYSTATASLTDLLLGSDDNDSNATKNFTAQTLLALASTAIITLPAYQDEAAAIVGGLAAGQLYQTTGTGAAPLDAAGIVMVKQ